MSTSDSSASERLSLLDAALLYASWGWRVFPINPDTKIPFPGGHGYHDATTDPDSIRGWWTDHPDSRIGIALRPSGLIAIDCDGAAGLALLAKLEAEHGALPRVCHQRSGSGGEHVVMRDPSPGPDGWTRVGGELRGNIGGAGVIDVKCNGYIVVAPSGRYEWLALDPQNVPEVPEPWQRLLRKQVATIEVAAPPVVGELAERVARGRRLVKASTHKLFPTAIESDETIARRRQLLEVLAGSPFSDPIGTGDVRVNKLAHAIGRAAPDIGADACWEIMRATVSQIPGGSLAKLEHRARDGYKHEVTHADAPVAPPASATTTPSAEPKAWTEAQWEALPPWPDGAPRRIPRVVGEGTVVGADELPSANELRLSGVPDAEILALDRQALVERGREHARRRYDEFCARQDAWRARLGLADTAGDAKASGVLVGIAAFGGIGSPGTWWPGQGPLRPGYVDRLAALGVPDDDVVRALLPFVDRLRAREDLAAELDALVAEHAAIAHASTPPTPAPAGPLAALACPPPKVLGSYLRDVAARARKPVRMFPTGFCDLDRKLGGGLATGQLTAVAAPPSLGKSAFVGSLAIALATARPVLAVSLELTSDEIMCRYAAHKLGIPWRDCVQGKVPREQLLEAVRDLRIKVVGCDDLFDDPDARKDPLAAIGRAAEAMQAECGEAPIVVIDYVQIMARGSDDGLRARVSELSMRIRQAAQLLDTIVLAVFTIGRSFYIPKMVSQLRQAGDPRGYLVTLKESGDIEYDAATVLFLDVDDQINGEGADVRRDARIVVARCRQGDEGFVGAVFYPATGRWVPDPMALARMSSERTEQREQEAGVRKLDENVRKLVTKVREGLTASPLVLRTASQWRDSGAVPSCRDAVTRALETGALVTRMMERQEGHNAKQRDIVVPPDWSPQLARPEPPPQAPPIHLRGYLGRES